jgi:hypothetical protein
MFSGIHQLQQGSPAFVTVTLNRVPGRVSGAWIGKTTSFSKSDDPKIWYALAGADLETQPGSYELSVTAVLPGGKVLKMVKPIFTINVRNAPAGNIAADMTLLVLPTLASMQAGPDARPHPSAPASPATTRSQGKRPVLAVCTSQEVSETIALKTRIVLRGDGGRFFDPESRRREAAAAEHREEAQDCGAGDAAWCIGGAGSATVWGQRQPGVLLAQPLSPRPSGREEHG